jgi:tetratricopeptide (TPR) repeat protein
LAEWQRARELNPKIPVLHTSIGVALLQVKSDPERALAAFRDAIRTDPQNEAAYIGADQALSLLHRSSAQRVDVFQHYPDLPHMPSGLVFELALNLAESDEFERAISLFHNRFFPREEGGTNVRQVWVEVQLQRALGLAKQRDCNEAIAIARQLGSVVPGLTFTNDGLQPFIDSARVSYLLGTLDVLCGRPEEASKRFEAVARRDTVGEIVWASRAAKELRGFDQHEWARRLASALQQASADTSSLDSWSAYNLGMINRALGREREADAAFRKALLLPDVTLSYHLVREEMAKQ